MASWLSKARSFVSSRIVVHYNDFDGNFVCLARGYSQRTTALGALMQKDHSIPLKMSYSTRYLFSMLKTSRGTAFKHRVKTLRCRCVLSLRDTNGLLQPHSTHGYHLKAQEDSDEDQYDSLRVDQLTSDNV